MPTDGKAQVPMSWPNHLPQYMYNFQGPAMHQMPPYQGYQFPGMPIASTYYPGNMRWPANVEDSGSAYDWEPDDRRDHKSSSKRKKKPSRKSRETSKEDESTEPSDSGSESESNEEHSLMEKMHRKKHGKKSSRKVVIRNINYITSKRDGDKGNSSKETSDEDEFIDGDSLKQQVEEAVGSLGKRHKSSSSHRRKQDGVKHRNGSDDVAELDVKNTTASNNGGEKRNDPWDIFQNLLLKDNDTSSFGMEPQSFNSEARSFPLNLESEQVRKERAISSDAFVATKANTGNEDETRFENFEAGEKLRQTVKKKDYAHEELLFSQRNEDPAYYSQATLSDFATTSTKIKSQNGDWIIVNQPDRSANYDESSSLKTFDGDYASVVAGGSSRTDKNKKDALADDSFMIQGRPLVDDQSDYHTRTDIIGATLYETVTPEISHDKPDAFNTYEPDDLYMVLGRDSATEQAAASWNPEMDYETNIVLTKSNEKNSNDETNVGVDNKLPSNGKSTSAKNKGPPGARVSGKDARSKVSNGKSDINSRSKKPSSGSRPTVLKSKLEKVLKFKLQLNS